MPQNIDIIGYDNNGTTHPVSAGTNKFTDGDGVDRFHALFTSPKRQQANISQAALAPNTLSNAIVADSATESTLFISVSAAGTVTIWIQSYGAGPYYQLYTNTGSAISLTMTNNQAVALPIPPCNAVAIKNTVQSDIVLETCGWVAG